MIIIHIITINVLICIICVSSRCEIDWYEKTNLKFLALLEKIKTESGE